MKNDKTFLASERGSFVYFRGESGGKNAMLSKRRIRQVAWWLNRILRRRRGIRRVELTMEYEISEYRFTIRESALIPADAELCEQVLLRPKIGELRTVVSSHDRLRSETYRLLFGKMFYGNREYFSDLEIFTLEPLLKDGKNSLQCRNIPGMEEVVLVQCKFRSTSGEILALHGPDIIGMIGDMKRSLLSGSEIISAKFRFRINALKNAQTLKIKLGNRAEFPYCCEKIIEAWLTERGFKHGSK